MKVLRDRPRSVDVDDFLARPLFAHLATASDEGARDSPVWFLWEDDAIWIIASRATDSFPSRVERDPRCAVGIVDFDRSSGRVHHVGVRGRASVEPFERERARRLLRRYLGSREERWDERFRATLTDPENVLVRVVPDTVVARDVSYVPTEDPRVEASVAAEEVVGRAIRWARGRSDVRALALVGSYARGTARSDSDVDLVLLTESPEDFVCSDAWAAELEAVAVTRTQRLGAVVSRVLSYPSGLEVEVSVGDPSWAWLDPIDPGTLCVVRGGFRVLHDPDSMLAALAAQAADQGAPPGYHSVP